MKTKEPIILEHGFAYTNESITNLKSQGNTYYLGYINYKTPEQQKCAVKIIDLDNEVARANAIREKEVLMRVNHNNIAQTYNIIEKDMKMYIFREYDEHLTLKAILSRFRNAAVDENDVLNLGIQLISCLSYMESMNLTNRDLNPANILFNKQKVYKIFDFGSSKVVDDNQLYYSMAVGFNECFMSPQMLEIDEIEEINYYKCDVWSLGMILYYFGENQYPWTRGNSEPKDLDEEIEKMQSRPLQFQRIRSIPIQNLIRKMLTYNQDQRPSAKELFEDELIQSQLPKVPQKSNQNPQQAQLEILSVQIQKFSEMKTKYEIDEKYEELVFNYLIRFFTKNKNQITQKQQVIDSYHQLLDYQMFNRKEICQNFKLQYNTKKCLQNYVNEFKRHSKLDTRQQEELLLLLQIIDCQKKFPDTPESLISMVETEYLRD